MYACFDQNPMHIVESIQEVDMVGPGVASSSELVEPSVGVLGHCCTNSILGVEPLKYRFMK
jgi:hypothetical protein